MIIDLNEVKQIDSLEVKYGEKSFMIPLGNHIPVKRIKALKTDDDIMKFPSKKGEEKIKKVLDESEMVC